MWTDSTIPDLSTSYTVHGMIVPLLQGRRWDHHPYAQFPSKSLEMYHPSHIGIRWTNTDWHLGKPSGFGTDKNICVVAHGQQAVVLKKKPDLRIRISSMSLVFAFHWHRTLISTAVFVWLIEPWVLAPSHLITFGLKSWFGTHSVVVFRFKDDMGSFSAAACRSGLYCRHGATFVYFAIQIEM